VDTEVEVGLTEGYVEGVGFSVDIVGIKIGKDEPRELVGSLVGLGDGRQNG
jgi:hypothetical protein